MGFEGRKNRANVKFSMRSAVKSGRPSVRWAQALALGVALLALTSTTIAEPSRSERAMTDAALDLSAADHGVAPRAKTATAGTRLLLPRYEVDTTNPSGITTLFAVRNEGGTPVDLTLRYHRTDGPQAPQYSENLTLAAKAVKTVNIRSVPNLATDPDGIRRGFVVIEASTEGATVMGDFFQITPGENFANGSRLLNIDPTSNHNDLCNLFSMRFLNGGGFDSGTLFTVFLDLPLAPTGSTAVMDILAYDEAGVLLLARETFADEVSFQVTASELLSPTVTTDFGAIEFQFRDGVVGHIAAVLSASGRYSVGFEASCGDF